MEKSIKSDEEKLSETRQKLIEAEEVIKKSSLISKNYRNYVLFLIAKHDILLDKIISEKDSKVDKIPLIKM